MTSAFSMLLIPGLLSAGDVWESVVAQFARSYRIHVVTLAGVAGVPALAQSDGSSSLLNLVRDDLLAYIHREHLERPVLVGHSLGAMLAMWVASAEPGSVGPIVAVDDPTFLMSVMDEFLSGTARR